MSLLDLWRIIFWLQRVGSGLLSFFTKGAKTRPWWTAANCVRHGHRTHALRQPVPVASGRVNGTIALVVAPEAPPRASAIQMISPIAHWPR